MRGAEAVVKALEQEGIRYITGFSGGGLAPLWGPLRRSATIRPFAARHERLGVEIADGYARATGEVGVAMTGTGPGATNCLTAIAGLLCRQHSRAAADGAASPAEPGAGMAAGSSRQHL